MRRLLDSGAAYYVDQDVYCLICAATGRFGYESNYPRAQMLGVVRRARRRPAPPRQTGTRSMPSCGGPSVPTNRHGTPTSDRAAPGWHIECAVIALNRLGESIACRAAGSDLIFPHHELSAAHAEALTDSFPFAQNYVHTGMIGLDGEKMSKSRGNLVFVSKLRGAGVDPMSRAAGLCWMGTTAPIGSGRVAGCQPPNGGSPDGAPASPARQHRLRNQCSIWSATGSPTTST